MIKNVQLSSSLSRLLNNPLCALQFSERSIPPDQWPVSVRLIENSAIVSSGVLINNIDLCSWRSYQLPYFNRNRTLRWDFVKYRYADQCARALVC